ncbi:WD40-repeat-containing domain protein [Lipomyces japonicus]|uniref:WD40-repeat-containing domain protein n=1 Tax=Lipomyces japonicus TaxID=56871 RepID=UPI0034CFB956
MVETEYERQRRENIERNNALLRELELQSLGSSIGPRVTTKRPPQASKPTDATVKRAKKKALPVVKREKLPPAVRRTSARLAGIQADSETARIKSEQDDAARREKEQQERQRKGGDMKFEDISQHGIATLWTFDDATSNGDASNGDVEENKIAGDIVTLRKDLSALKLYSEFPPNDIKITPERIYTIGFHPTTSKQLILAGDKVGNLGVFDGSQTNHAGHDDNDDNDTASASDDPEPQVFIFKVHSRTLSDITFAPSVLGKVFTASYDGSIRSVDFSTGVSSEVFYSEIDANEPDAISQIQFTDANSLYFATLNGEVGHIDLRSDPKKISRYRLHEKKIGGFSLRPDAPHLCVTASLDRTMKLWDFRMINRLHDGQLQPKMLSQYDSRLSISAANWNSVGDVVCNGYDDTINVFNLRDSAFWAKNYAAHEWLTPTSTIRHNCQTGRWVTILRSQWQANPLDQIQKFVIGNMKRYMDVYTSDGIQLARLGDHELISAVPAAAKFHPTKNWIVGGTASGKVCLYT